MIVVHPKDRTTAMLSALYDGLEAYVVDLDCSNKVMGHLLYHTSMQERIMLLGHGCEKGLFFRKDDEKEDFDSIIVGHPQAHCLRRHGGNIIGIWCHAVDFARKEGLHGLFSGMIISDKKEAEEYGIITLQPIIEDANDIMFAQLRKLLDDNIPLHEIPERMKVLNPKSGSWLTNFNYENFYYL